LIKHKRSQADDGTASKGKRTIYLIARTTKGNIIRDRETVRGRETSDD
jgi:hypothetical protein